MAKEFDIESIIESASQAGADTDLLYRTTLERYRTLLVMMQDLKSAIKEYGNTVTKEYVKGRPNLVINPAIKEYNHCVTGANQTAQVLLKIVQQLGLKSITDVTAEDDEL